MKNKKRIVRIIIGGLIYLAALLTSSEYDLVKFILFFSSYLIVGLDVLMKAGKNILHGQVFDENFLMSIATIGALFIGEYPEGVAVMLFYQVGEVFQSYAVDQSRRSIAELMDIRPDYANVKQGEGLVRKEPDEVNVGDTIVVKAGEKIPLDGEVIKGSSMVDTSALTGESVLKEVYKGSAVFSGCVNINGMIEVKTTKEFAQSTVSKILDLVENAAAKKSKSENFITKFARVYTPFVVITAACLAVIPPLVTSAPDFTQWLSRALVFLVVSCPCAIVISVPLSFFGGIGGASRCGILVKGSNYLEALSHAEVVVFDKTGTLTEGVFEVQDVWPVQMEKEALLAIASYAESYSNHPISLSLKKAYGKEIDHQRVSDVQEIPGKGVRAVVDGKTVLAGNRKLMESQNVSYYKDKAAGTVVHVAVDDCYAGYILISDRVKKDAEKTIRQLKNLKIKKIVMLTGDATNIGKKIAKDLGIDTVYCELLPDGKMEKMEELFEQKSVNGKLVYVGDGINDAPVLARSDVGVAMGGLGSDAAIEAADVVIMTDEPSKVPDAIKIANRTLQIAWQNIIFALFVKGAVLILGAVGIATMWAAVFADVGVAVLAILNAMRMLKVQCE